MPSEDGELSRDEKTAVVAKIAAKCHGQKCPACGSDRWYLADHVIHLQSLRVGRQLMGGPAYPAVVVICNRCGHMRLHSALILGINFPDIGGMQ